MKSEKQLANHVIIYDDECPMCNVYTGAFVKFGFLDTNGRKSFSSLQTQDFCQLDMNRSTNEIPLVNLQTGKVTYGLPSLLKILSHRWKAFHLVERIKPLFWLISKFYRFISFNRKVIVPGKDKGQACVPTFHLTYRLLYLLLTVLVTGLTAFALFNQFVPDSTVPLLIWIGFMLGQIVVQLPLLRRAGKEQIFEYLGNQMTVNMIGAILAWPLLIMDGLMAIPTIATAIYLTLVAITLVILLYKRIRMLQRNQWLCINWIFYWTLISFIAL